jgi:hypothetical protein
MRAREMNFMQRERKGRREGCERESEAGRKSGFLVFF